MRIVNAARGNLLLVSGTEKHAAQERILLGNSPPAPRVRRYFRGEEQLSYNLKLRASIIWNFYGIVDP